MEAVEIGTRQGRLDLRMDQALQLSRPAWRAVRNGVPLVLELSLELRDGETMTLLAQENHAFVIRYLPLSERFELTDPVTGKRRNYPRLRHVLRDLSDLDVAMETPPLAPGRYELRARLRLDRARLPAPMQLPALVIRAWRHDSDWTRWPFTTSA